MKTRQQPLHDEGGKSRAGKEGDAQKLDDVRVTKCAHQLALPHELARGLGQIFDSPVTLLQEGVDGFGGGGHRESHLVHSAIVPSADPGASELNIRENERPQPGMVAEKTFSHCLSECSRRKLGVSKWRGKMKVLKCKTPGVLCNVPCIDIIEEQVLLHNKILK